jgi:hypothetical protein
LQQITSKKQEEERKKKEKEDLEKIKRQKLKDKVLQGAKIESKFLQQQVGDDESEPEEVMAQSEQNPNLGSKRLRQSAYATLGLNRQQTEPSR